MANNVSDFAVPATWAIIVITLATVICICSVTYMNSHTTTSVQHLEKGYVKVNMRYPNTFIYRDIWVKAEDVELYTRMNLGLERSVAEIKALPDVPSSN